MKELDANEMYKLNNMLNLFNQHNTFMGLEDFKGPVRAYKSLSVPVVTNAGTGPGPMEAGQVLVYVDTDGGHSYWVFCDGTNRYGHSEDLTLATTWTGLS